MTVVALNGARVLAEEHAWPAEVGSVVARLAGSYPGADVLVKTKREAAPTPSPAAPSGRGLSVTPRREEGEVELAHHLLWDSYQRAAQTQAFMLEQMTGVAAEMNARFVEQMTRMQTQYHEAMGKVDHMVFEQKMIEHEAMGRRLSEHHRRLAADERRANEPSTFEQLAGSMVKILEVLIDPSPSRQK